MGTKMPNSPPDKSSSLSNGTVVPLLPPSKKPICIEIVTPECDKLSRVANKSQIIGEFLEWLTHERSMPIELCVQGDSFTDFVPCYITLTTLLAEYFGIDQNKVEQERRAILDMIRKQDK